MDVLVWSDMRRDVPGWDEAIAFIQRSGHTIVDPGPGKFDEPAKVQTADAIIVGGNHIGGDFLRSATQARLIAKPGIGVDQVDVTVATELGIGVSNTPGSNTDAVADHTIALMLAVLRNLIPLDAATRTGHGWDTWPTIGRELYGSVVAVLGTGNIGSAVAKRLALGFDAQVLAYDLVRNPELERRFAVRYGQLDEILPLADIVTIHLPLIAESRGLLGRTEIESLKPNAVVINAARGGVVDESALAEALRSGRLAGAGIDVFAEEPAHNSALLGLSNTVLTLHIAGYSRSSMMRARITVAEDVIAALDGRPRHLVNPEVLASPLNRLVRR